jgi:hypothetical protein
LSIIGIKSGRAEYQANISGREFRDRGCSIFYRGFYANTQHTTTNSPPLPSEYEANENYDFERHMTKLLIVERETILNNYSLAHSTINWKEDFEICGICNIATPSGSL